MKGNKETTKIEFIYLCKTFFDRISSYREMCYLSSETIIISKSMLKEVIGKIHLI